MFHPSILVCHHFFIVFSCVWNDSSTFFWFTHILGNRKSHPNFQLLSSVFSVSVLACSFKLVFGNLELKTISQAPLFGYCSVLVSIFHLLCQLIVACSFSKADAVVFSIIIFALLVRFQIMKKKGKFQLELDWKNEGKQFFDALEKHSVLPFPFYTYYTFLFCFIFVFKLRNHVCK